jgi:hypothetical protein
MSRSDERANENEGREQGNPARAGARASSSWIRALANAWEDDWSRTQNEPEEKEETGEAAPGGDPEPRVR